MIDNTIANKFTTLTTYDALSRAVIEDISIRFTNVSENEQKYFEYQSAITVSYTQKKVQFALEKTIKAQ